MIGLRKGRRAALIGVGCAALIAIALPPSAGASFDRHFTVISEDVRSHETENSISFRTLLFNPANLDNQVGHSHVRCRFSDQSRKARCRGLFHLDGTIGGFGDLLVRGNIGGRDHTLNVVDGNGDFSGRITGKVFVHKIDQPVNRIDFDLTR